MQSNNDLGWNEERVCDAAADGWLLALTVDSGKRIADAYYNVYPHGPKFADPHRAARHVMSCARGGSRLHMTAIQLIAASRLPKEKK